MKKFKRTLADLQRVAVLHWPTDILQKAGESSVLPLLIQTQETFLSLLKTAQASPTSWKAVLPHSGLSGSLFLKHLMVLSDLGGEALNKIPPITRYFPKGVMFLNWHGKPFEYRFQEIIKKCSLTNSALKVDAKGLLIGHQLNGKLEDVANLILLASLSTHDTLPTEIKDKCIIGSLIGNSDELEKFVRESYIRVSRQVSGATANTQGHLVQNYVIEKLKAHLPETWQFVRDGNLTNVTRSGKNSNATFDVVAKSPSGKEFGVEVSFQVTTNSTIEQKASKAMGLKTIVHKAGHKICHVLDGAGNINIRQVASSIICANSDCTVAMSDEEIQLLAKYFLHVESGN
jgi:hypothetical protein